MDQKKQLERELELSEKKFRTIAETANDSIIITNQDSYIIFFNSKAIKTFGYTSEELLGQHLDIIMPIRFFKAHRQGVEKFMNIDAPNIIGHTIEIEGRKKDGTILPIELSLSY